MSQAFAGATNQEFGVYHAVDTIGRGSQKTTLCGQNARDAWNTPIKSCAEDLSGWLVLVIGMPIYIVDNIAVELGLANGSGGTLVNVEYEMHEGRRYAISAEVDLALYTSPDPKARFPHHVVIPLKTGSITFKKGSANKIYTACRTQLPLIAGFSFTAHNSQSCSLNAATIHLESCASIAASYVMLSRIKCGENDLNGLAILGNVNAKNINNHAPEEVRTEEKCLKQLAASTLVCAKEDIRWYIDLTGDSFD
ncbi:hypothetical protein C8R43DRAFT_947522 [Mycena crocata]|nr:hypothetical protein C8R43DRAFT_947522 [Mycena crocata]